MKQPPFKKSPKGSKSAKKKAPVKKAAPSGGENPFAKGFGAMGGGKKKRGLEDY